MATVEQCEQALHELAARLAESNAASASGQPSLDRSLSCTLRDLGAIFAGRLKAGHLTDIRPADTADAQVRLVMTSDDLLALVDGTLNMGSAWATGRVKVHAGMRDLLRLRTIF